MRIIPARAGFTSTWASRTRRPRDHPRSRGVYEPFVNLIDCWPGSSPLARGLHTAGWPTVGFARIIPARAGFTHRRRPCWLAGADHPRSRGVYARMPPAPPARSDHPRSRGVYAVSADGGDTDVRIIPARAGFTLAEILLRERIEGSSPLARGLRDGQIISGCEPRIIPARAGFTRVGHARPISPTDHPRSRGVYADFGMLSEDEAGSSPLARGLPTAGTRRPEWQADHPRSRGVYSSIEVPAAAATGSSPLARGLHPRWRSGRGSAGIIPARAGFT